MLGPLLFILNTSEMFELLENKQYAYADDTTLLAVVRKPTDRPAVAVFLNRDLSRIQEWCNHWCMILYPNKMQALLVSRSKTVNPPHGDLVLSVVSICASPKINILGVKYDSRLTLKDHVRGIVSHVSQRIGVFDVGEHVFVDTTVLLSCYYSFVLQILEYCSPVWGFAAECHLQLLERPVYSVARLCHDQTFLLLCHRRHVGALCMLYKFNSNSNYCLFSELPSDSAEFVTIELQRQLIH